MGAPAMNDKQLSFILRNKFDLNWPCADRFGKKELASGEHLVVLQPGMFKVCFGAERKGSKRPVVVAVTKKDWDDCDNAMSTADVIAIPIVFEKFNCKVVDPSARFERREAMMASLIYKDMAKCAIHNQELSHTSLLVIRGNRMLFYEPMLLEAPYIIEAVSVNVKNFLQNKIKKGDRALGPCSFHPMRMIRSFVPLNLCWYSLLFSIEQVTLGNLENVQPFEDEKSAREAVDRYISYLKK